MSNIKLVAFLILLYTQLLAITEDQAINAILGEIRGGSRDQMQNVADALYNYNKLNGVDGYAPKHYYKEEMRIKAKKAWINAKRKNRLNASHWHASGITPYWAKYGVLVLDDGKHKFYKCKKHGVSCGYIHK